MDDRATQFRALLVPIVRRWFAQNGAGEPAEAEIADFATRLWAVVEKRGLPRPLSAGEVGAPGELPEGELVPMVRQVLPADASPLFGDVAKQLVKACFYPEFTTCRDSFCAMTSDGACRRQELARVRKRVSGTHCVDCPHWVAFSPAEHATFLRPFWRAGAAEFEAHRGVYLPEDFRALRVWLWRQARR